MKERPFAKRITELSNAASVDVEKIKIGSRIVEELDLRLCHEISYSTRLVVAHFIKEKHL